ncbi:MAG: hypothetical protein JWM99_4092 [Verrucomicrobiales bacterium]|nr:hypothetical protein [Verrucomicrobiales bacterium]
MSYAALEVELCNGRVIPREGEPLPAAGRALLVLLETQATDPKKNVGNMSQVLSLIRARQLARGHTPRSADAITQQVRRERESWD